MSNILISVLLWTIISLVVFAQYAHNCAGLPIGKKMGIVIVFIVGGPFFAIANILEILLDIMMPEGWSDDEDFKGH